MAATFDARSLFDVFPESHHFTCVGTTKQGLRCRNSFIRNAYLCEASQILDNLPAITSSSRRAAELLLNLRRLAYITLCPRWHQARLPQVEPVAHRWLAMIQGVTRRPAYPLTPPASPLPVTRQLTNYTTTYLPPPALLTPPTTPQPATRQTLFGHPTRYTSPQAQTSQVEPTMPSHHPTSNRPISSNTEQTRTHTSRTGRNVNIRFNVNVDSNQNLVEHATHTPGHGQTPSSPTDSTTSNESGSSRSSQASTSRSTSSTSSSSSESRRVNALEAQIAALTEATQAQARAQAASQAQIAALLEVLQAQAQTPRTLRSSSRSISPGSPVPISSPRSPLSIRTSNLSSLSGRDRNNSSFSVNSPSSSTSSSSSHRPGGAIAVIHTPTSPTPSSPDIPSPPARSAAPSPSAGSQASNSALVRRRPINPDTTCYVCYSPIVRPGDAAWCRGSCGQNICLECFVQWVEEQRQGEREVRCGNCRAVWVF